MSSKVWCAAALLCLCGLAAAQFDTCFIDGPITKPPTSWNFTGVDRFGLEMFRKVARQTRNGENLLMSPYSVWTTLSLALLGASGNTRRQLEAVLGLPTTKIGAYRTKFALDFVMLARTNAAGGPEMRTTDTAYFDNSVKIRDCVPRIIHKVKILDFSNTAQAAREINGDILVGTGNQIKDFLSPSSLINAVFVLTNAVYFKGTWQTKFDAKDTSFKEFHVTPHQSVSVPMMTQKGKFNVVQSLAMGATILELPYSNSTISMFLLLPDDDALGVDHILENLSPFTLDDALSNRKERLVHLTMPKFDLETEVKNELEQAMVAMGLRDMFSASRANFRDFSRDVSMSVSAMIHKAKVIVNEHGTIAVAATSIIGTRSGPPQYIPFTADKPLVFIIYETKVRVSLFAGVIRNPSA